MTHQMTAAGLTTDDYETIWAEIELACQTRISPLLDLGETSPLGALLRVLAERERTVVEAVEEVYAGSYPSTAAGTQLGLIAEITGTFWREGTPSTLGAASADVFLSAGTTLPPGAAAAVTGYPDRRFLSAATVTNPGPGDAWVPCAFDAEEVGPTSAPSGSLTVIAEPYPGWLDVRSTADAVLGTNDETPAELRERRREELYRGGSATVGAIRAALLSDARIRFAVVLDNIYDWTDGNGLPAHSISATIYDGLDWDAAAPVVPNDDVAEIIHGVIAAGIRSHGYQQGAYTDDDGETHEYRFERAREAGVDVTLFLTSAHYSATLYPTDADAEAAIEDAITAYLDGLDVGAPVVYRQVCRAALNVEGVYDFTSLDIGWTGGALGTVNLLVAWNEIAYPATIDATVA